MDHFTEWTFEGGLNDIQEVLQEYIRVGVTGNRTRYQSGVYDSTWESGLYSQDEWYRDNKILLPSQAIAWDGFLYLKTKTQYTILRTFKTDFFQKTFL